MTLREQYLRALFPDKARVLGWRMSLYTLGHALLLERLCSPLVVGPPGSCGPGDLSLAIATCRRSFPEAARLCGSWRLKASCLIQLRRCSARLLLGEMQFRMYVAAGWSRPTAWEKPRSRAHGTPALNQVRIELQRSFGMSLADALKTPLSLALHDVMGAWESDDKTEIVGDDEAELIRRAEELARSADAAGGEG